MLRKRCEAIRDKRYNLYNKSEMLRKSREAIRDKRKTYTL